MDLFTLMLIFLLGSSITLISSLSYRVSFFKKVITNRKVFVDKVFEILSTRYDVNLQNIIDEAMDSVKGQPHDA